MEIKFGEVDSVEFAIYLNKKAKEKNIEINLTKIQKLLYICYGIYFALNKKQLLNELPKAWDYGPVFPRVHKMQKKHGGNLDNLLSEILLIRTFEKYDDLIDLVLGHFGSWNATELVVWTHTEGSAWDKKYNIQNEKYFSIDNFDIISDFDAMLINEDDND